MIVIYFQHVNLRCTAVSFSYSIKAKLLLLCHAHNEPLKKVSQSTNNRLDE